MSTAQDVLRCDRCKTHERLQYCDAGHIKLCKFCAEDHHSNRSREHSVVLFERQGSTIDDLYCKKHVSKKCKLNCEQCDIPICEICVTSNEHQRHTLVEIGEVLTSKKERIKKDLEEIEKFIYPNYQQALSNIPVQKANAELHSKKLTTELKKQG